VLVLVLVLVLGHRMPVHCLVHQEVFQEEMDTGMGMDMHLE